MSSVPSVYHTKAIGIRDSGGHADRCLPRFRSYRCTMTNGDLGAHQPRRRLPVTRAPLSPVHVAPPSAASTLLSTAKHYHPERLIGCAATAHSANCCSRPWRIESDVLSRGSFSYASIPRRSCRERCNHRGNLILYHVLTSTLSVYF